MSTIHILEIVRRTDNPTGGISLSHFLNSNRIGVVNAITAQNERCWIVYELSGPIEIPPNSSLEELVCEQALAMTRTIFLALTISRQVA
jgi:hypothetical protein